MQELFPEPDLPHGSDLIAEGRALAPLWPVGPSAFLRHVGAASECDFKRTQMAARTVMQHAQIGYRDRAKSYRAYAEIWGNCSTQGVTVHRYGLCLDWSVPNWGYMAADNRGPCAMMRYRRAPPAVLTKASR